MRVRGVERGPEWRTVEQVDGRRVGVTVAGDGYPLVLLHGLGRDRRDWSEVLAGLAERWRVYALDMEGAGRSEAWSDRVTLRSMARMVRRTLTALGETRPVVVVGNSMGGAVALRVHADDPAAVAALVLASPAGFGPEATVGLRLMAVPGLGRALLTFRRPAAALQTRALFTDRALATRALAAEALERLKNPETRRRYFEMVHDLGQWRGVRPEWRAEVLPVLAEAGTPTLVLWGDHDSVLPHAHLAAAAAALPHATTRTLDGLGHAPQLEDPDGFVREVTSFLEGVLSPDGRSGSAPGATPPA